MVDLISPSDAEVAINPLLDPEDSTQLPDPSVLVIFGASGDLTARKLVPALWHLHVNGLLSDRFAMVGVARTHLDDTEFRNKMRDAVGEFGGDTIPDGMMWDAFAERLHYQPLIYDDDTSYFSLKDRIGDLDRKFGTNGNVLYYVATPPTLYTVILSKLGGAGLAKTQSGSSRVVIEKPFGRDRKSATELNRHAVEVFGEENVYRIDHYLGKETVQNILVFRFANGIFEPIWNREYIDHVQITAAETVGVEARAGYYDQAGCLRDMFQNHMLQLLCYVAMEPPTSLEAESVRNEKVKVLEAIQPFSSEEAGKQTVRAQYGHGAVAGSEVQGYRDESGVADDSKTETYAAVKLEVDTWRFAGVPFYIRSGKRMAKRDTEISIQFKAVPHLMFPSGHEDQIKPNVLTMRIQPDEGITLSLEAKVPGPTMHVRPVHMDFDYGTTFGQRSADAYERLLLDALAGDQMLFARGDWVETSWGIIDPILEAWNDTSGPLPQYDSGGWGPEEAEEFMERDGREWRRL